MKFLIDTNVFIPLEPTNKKDTEELTEATTRLSRIAIEQNHQLFLHPEVITDISRDLDESRTILRKIQTSKYPSLENPPQLPAELFKELGQPERGTNDWVDNQLLAVLAANAVDFVVTEDKRLHRKAIRIGLGDRTTTIQEAISIIIDLSEITPKPPPAVHAIKAYGLNTSDAIFDSLKEDYPGFEMWLQKCSREHRQSWKIETPDGRIAGFCIVDKEEEVPEELSGSVLKLCSFKVSELHNGFRFGELLLKSVFNYATENSYDWLYITVFEKYAKLLRLLNTFGFADLTSKTDLGEKILAKPMNPNAGEPTTTTPLEFNIRYGPHFFRLDTPSWYVVPIRPIYSNILFPETNPAGILSESSTPYGNALRKAYLCGANIYPPPSGSVLLFYRSGYAVGGITIGITEFSSRLTTAREIARTVGKRTVYTFKDIENMCQSRPWILTIVFRQGRVFDPIISRSELEEGLVFSRPPQSIMQIRSEGKESLRRSLAN
ncbi:MAG: hypothetical protein KAV87_62860 [Desulfobacteraceae bacterium]|nr:hypothetical protein [Desulfobacteraceae bacterium]